jgi:segregation and condensation protein A
MSPDPPIGNDVRGARGAHSVALDVFEGPLDLLLHLITRRRIDIYEVSLAAIASDYVAALRDRDDLDLESATGFLVVAATLLELKSSRLLPGPAEAPEEARLLEERDVLLARLVECSTFRAAGAWIAGRLEEGGSAHGRTAGLEPRFAGLVPDVLAGTSIEDLARAAARSLAPRPEPEIDVTHIAPATASVRDAIHTLAAQLRVGSEMTFRELCSSARRRMDVVVRFLGLLELFKAGAVSLGQADRFGEIRARWTGEVSAEEVAADAEEYTAAPTSGAGAARDRREVAS